MKSSRNYIIDVFRGVAVLLVTAFHVFLWSSSPGYSFFNKWDLFGPMGNGWVGVGLFFIISGYCMGMSTRRTFSSGLNTNEYKIYFTKRFLRIAIPYYISILFWCYMINVHGVAVKPTGLTDILMHMFFVHNLSDNTMFSISGVYWSLAVEMQFYIVLPIVVALIKTRKEMLYFLIACLFLTVLINTTSVNRVLTWSLLSYLYLFILGWVLFYFNPNQAIHKYLKKFSIIMFIIFMALLFYKGEGFNNNIKIYETLTSTVAALFMWACINIGQGVDGESNVIIKGMSFIGRCSFSIYLYNYIFWIFPRDDVGAFKSFLVFAFVIFFGIGMYFIFERPSERMRNGLFKKIYQ